MRYEVVARKGLLLREGYATDSDKVCEARKGSFVVALGPQRDVGGVCRLEVVTPEGLRGWCSLKAQLLAPRDDGEQPSAEEAMAELVVAALSSRAHRDLSIWQPERRLNAVNESQLNENTAERCSRPSSSPSPPRRSTGTTRRTPRQYSVCADS